MIRDVVPPSPSTFSAWGMLATDLRHDLVRTVLEPLAQTDAAWAAARYAEMQREIESILPRVGTPVTQRAADLRYLGQEHTVTVPVESLDAWRSLRDQFDEAHRRAYGYAATDVDVQLLNLRLAVVYPLEHPHLPPAPRGSAGARAFETRQVYSMRAQGSVECRVYQRDRLGAGDRIEGPAAVEEAGTTTVIDSGDVLSVEEHGCLVVDIARSP